LGSCYQTMHNRFVMAWCVSITALFHRFCTNARSYAEL